MYFIDLPTICNLSLFLRRQNVTFHFPFLKRSMVRLIFLLYVMYSSMILGIDLKKSDIKILVYTRTARLHGCMANAV